VCGRAATAPPKRPQSSETQKKGHSFVKAIGKTHRLYLDSHKGNNQAQQKESPKPCHQSYPP
jgi:hypothetical protein